MKIEKLVEFIGKVVVIHKNPNHFALRGIIYEADMDDNTIKFVTSEKSSYMDADLIVELVEENRTVAEELCNHCKKCFYRKTGDQLCPFCGK